MLFVRSDMEQGNWTQEEFTVNAIFPFDAGKVIERGQRISFRDPATGSVEVFEIRNVTNIEPDHYQQIVAEHIAVSELSDEHVNSTEITNKTAAQALTTVLTGTGWSVGNNSASGTSSADIPRGSVWQAINTIQRNWNCYLTPYVTVNSSGAITGKYIDITPAQAVFRGVRLSIDKNLEDSSVTYDDTEVLTALYGYGGMVTVENQSTPDESEELTFAGVTWTATSDHPAKPYGQTYLEDPAKTALYGRNGRARFGYYQNSDIKDANILLQKTWEALKATSSPKISISGMVADLYRLGYADQPLRLHDLAIVEVRQTGEVFQKEIIRLDVDLIDPSATRPEIGDYIPNIIYINRETFDYATTGGAGGGGGGRGQVNVEAEKYDTYSGFEQWTNEYGSMIGMVVGKRNGNNYIKAAEISLSINSSTGETGAYINADHINISANQTVQTLAGAMELDANGDLIIKDGAGFKLRYSEGGSVAEFGVWDKGNLTGGIMAQQINGQTETLIKGDHVNISGTNTVQTLAGAMELDASGNLIIKNGAGFRLQKTISGSTAQFGVWDQNNLTAGVVATIVNGVSSTYIYADKILMSSSSGANNVAVEVSGKLTANDITAQFLDAKIGQIPTLHGIAASFTGNVHTTSALMGYQVYSGTSGSGYVNISDPVNAVQVVPGTTSGTYKLQYKKCSDSTWQDGGDFNRATSATIKVSGSWSGATYMVSADENGQTLPISTNVTVYAMPRSGQISDEFTVYAATPLGGSNYDNHASRAGAIALSGSGSSAKANVSLGGTTVARLDVGSLYSDGQTAAGLTYDTSAHTISRAYDSSAKTYSVSMTQGNWYNGSLNVSAIIGANVTINSTSVSLPAVSSTTWTNTTGRIWRADLTIGGVTRSSSVKDFGGYYTDGQTAAGLELDTTNHKVKRATYNNAKEYTVSVDTTGNWSSGSKTVYAKLGSTQMASGTVALPTISGFDTTSPDGYSILSGQGSSATVRINTKGTWSQGGKSFSGTSYLQATPTQLYRDAYAAVTIPTNTCAAGTAQSATITATASNGATKDCTVTVSGSGWGSGGTYAQIKIGSTVIARQWFELPSSASWSSYKPNANLISVTCQVAGKSYTQSFSV